MPMPKAKLPAMHARDDGTPHPGPRGPGRQPQRSLSAVCLPGPGAHEVVPPCFATHVAGSVLSWLSRTLKNTTRLTQTNLT